MNTSGVSGNQSTKDIFAHLKAQNKVLVIWLNEAQAGRVYIDSLFDLPDLNGRYATVYEANKDRSAAQVVTTFRQTLDELEACIELLINEELTNAELTDWFVIIRWKRKRELWKCIAHDSYEHLQQYLHDIECWFIKHSSINQ